MSGANRRRDFLKGLAGGVAAGFPAIVPSCALGRDGYVAPSEKIVMGAIGVGRQGSGDMRAFPRPAGRAHGRDLRRPAGDPRAWRNSRQYQVWRHRVRDVQRLPRAAGAVRYRLRS